MVKASAGGTTKDLRFLGSLTCATRRLVAGEWGEFLIEYRVGESGIADGGRLKLAFKFYSDWALFQTGDPRAANYVSVEYQAAPCRADESPAPCRRSRSAST